MTDKHPGGRPTEYTPEVYQTALAYLDNYNTEHGHVIPSVVGLCKVLKRASATLYRWANEKSDVYHPEFREIVDAINDGQHFKLMDGGLTGEFNSNIAKLLLHKHGHNDKKETELTVDGINLTMNYGNGD